MTLPRLLAALLGLAIVGGLTWLVLLAPTAPPPEPGDAGERETRRDPGRAPDDPPGPSFTADIRGVVRGPDGAGYAGATVSLYRPRAETGEAAATPARVLEGLAYAASTRGRVLRIETRRIPRPPKAVSEVRTGSDGSYRMAVALGRDYRVRAAAAGLSSALSAIVRAGDRADLELTRGASLRGRVENEAGEPVPGAEMVLLPDGASGASGPDGSFEIVGLAPGPRTLRVAAEGYATRRLPLVLPARGLDRNVTLSRGLVLDVEAEVEDAEGRDRPAAGAVVAFVETETGEYHQATTGPDGRARLEGVAAGTYDAAAHLEGAVPHTIWSLEVTASRTVTFIMETEAISTILVLGPDGRPVPDARFLLADADGELDVRVSREVGRSDGSGRFRFAFDDDAREVLWVTAAGYSAALIEPDDPAEAEEITVLLRHGAGLGGRVVDEQGRPISGAVVIVESEHDDVDDEVVRTVLTDEDGTFRVENLLQGEVDIEVTASGFRPADATIDALVPGQAPLEVVMKRGLEIRGRVVDAAGVGAAGVAVRARNASRETARTDESGAFRIGAVATRLGPEDIRLEFTHGALIWSATTRVGSEPTFTIPESAVLAGRVVAGPEAATVPRFRLEVVGPDRRVRQRIGVNEPTGAFRVRIPDEPDLVLRVKTETHETWSTRLGSIAPADREQMEIRLESPARLRVGVTGPDGTPLPAARVKVEASDGAWTRLAVTARNGIAAVRGAPGAVRVRVTHREFTAAEVDGVVLSPGRETREDVRLGAPGLIRIRVLRRGTPILTSATRFRSAASSGPKEMCVLASRGTEPVTVTVEGRGAALLALLGQRTEGDVLVLRGLPAGSYTVSATSGPNRSPSVPFQVVPGSTRTLELELGR